MCSLFYTSLSELLMFCLFDNSHSNWSGVMSCRDFLFLWWLVMLSIFYIALGHHFQGFYLNVYLGLLPKFFFFCFLCVCVCVCVCVSTGVWTQDLVLVRQAWSPFSVVYLGYRVCFFAHTRQNHDSPKIGAIAGMTEMCHCTQDWLRREPCELFAQVGLEPQSSQSQPPM
jgi:hypothetical protein